jgi:chromosome segregation ATPase
VKEEILALQSTQLTELEARVLSAGEAVGSVLRDKLSSMHQQAAEEAQQRLENGIKQVEDGAQGLTDTVTSMRIRITAAEERAMRVQRETQNSVLELITKLDALSTSAATSTDLAELRKKMETTQLEMITHKQVKRRSSPRPHGSSVGGVMPTALQDGLSDELSEEISAHLLKLSKQVNAWEDKLVESQQIQRVSMTRLQERVQRCHGKFDEAKAGVVKLEESVHLALHLLEANNERMKQHDDRADAVDNRISKDEGRIHLLESVDDETKKQIANLVQRSADLENGMGKANEAVSAADIERALLAENIEKLRARLESTEKDVLAVDKKVDKNGQDDVNNQVKLQAVCDKNAARSDGLEKDLARMEEALRGLFDTNAMKADDLRKDLAKVEQSVQDATALGPKMTQLKIRVDHLDRLMQEDVGMHQRRFDDGTALARESVSSKRRESKEKLDARVRRKSERLKPN